MQRSPTNGALRTGSQWDVKRETVAAAVGGQPTSGGAISMEQWLSARSSERSRPPTSGNNNPRAGGGAGGGGVGLTTPRSTPRSIARNIERVFSAVSISLARALG